jgi:hypothetical protein
MSRTPGHVIRRVRDRSATAIGKRLSQVRGQANRERLEPLLRKLSDFQRSLLNLVGDAGKEPPISSEERQSGMLEIFRKLGLPHRVLNGLYEEIVFQDEGSDIMEMHDAGLLSDKAFLERPHRPMPPMERGQRLTRAVITCRDTLATFDPGFGGLGQIIKKLGQRCLDDIVEELARLQVLRLCEYCEKPFFPATPTKRYCSLDYEGEDCSGKHRSNEYYHRKPRQKKRPRTQDSN